MIHCPEFGGSDPLLATSSLFSIAWMELKHNKGHDKYHASGTHLSMLTECKLSFTNYTLTGVAESPTSSDILEVFGVSNTKKASCPCRARDVFLI